MSEPLRKSDRGFQQGDPISGTDGDTVRVYESSAAIGPHLWVNITEPTNRNDPEGPVHDATVHLKLEDATRLRDDLTAIIENHYQL